GTLELTASGTTQSAVRVEEGTLKGDVADIFPYASSLWVGDGATFVTGADQDIQSIDAISSGTIDISDGTVLRLTGQDTSVALNASLFNGDGTLVNATDGVTLTGELNTNLETDSQTYLPVARIDHHVDAIFPVTADMHIVSTCKIYHILTADNRSAAAADFK
ncbi:hypothetical protein ACUODJ_33845, partial [Escherichia sp. HC-CC]